MAISDVATTEYDVLYDLVTRRASYRKLKPDPIPDEYIDKILEAARWAMSGANSQPWEYIVVKNPETKRELFRAYSDEVRDYTYWMEQQRVYELRHPAYAMSENDPKMKEATLDVGFAEAPAFICVVGDGRRQSGTVQGAHTFGREQTHLTDGLANTCTLIHLAAASLGLGAQWVTIPIQEPFKRILGVPDLLTFYLIIPIGYPAVPPRQGVRRPLEDMTHHEHYDMSKYMSNKRALEYLYELRGKTRGMYRHSYTGDAEGEKK
jgi:nicotinate-nucleotide--dimethylbenzimidazole phosphoribosyltransferase